MGSAILFLIFFGIIVIFIGNVDMMPVITQARLNCDFVKFDGSCLTKDDLRKRTKASRRHYQYYLVVEKLYTETTTHQPAQELTDEISDLYSALSIGKDASAYERNWPLGTEIQTNCDYVNTDGLCLSENAIGRRNTISTQGMIYTEITTHQTPLGLTDEVTTPYEAYDVTVTAYDGYWQTGTKMQTNCDYVKTDDGSCLSKNDIENIDKLPISTQERINTETTTTQKSQQFTEEISVTYLTLPIDDDAATNERNWQLRTEIRTNCDYAKTDDGSCLSANDIEKRDKISTQERMNTETTTTQKSQQFTDEISVSYSALFIGDNVAAYDGHRQTGTKVQKNCDYVNTDDGSCLSENDIRKQGKISTQGWYNMETTTDQTPQDLADEVTGPYSKVPIDYDVTVTASDQNWQIGTEVQTNCDYLKTDSSGLSEWDKTSMEPKFSMETTTHQTTPQLTNDISGPYPTVLIGEDVMSTIQYPGNLQGAQTYSGQPASQSLATIFFILLPLNYLQ